MSNSQGLSLNVCAPHYLPVPLCSLNNGNNIAKGPSLLSGTKQKVFFKDGGGVLPMGCWRWGAGGRKF